MDLFSQSHKDDPYCSKRGYDDQFSSKVKWIEEQPDASSLLIAFKLQE